MTDPKPSGPPAVQPLRSITDPRILAILDPRKKSHFRYMTIAPAGSGTLAKAKKTGGNMTKKINSKELSRIVGVNHRDMLTKIRLRIAKKRINPELSEVKAKNNRMIFVYLLTRKETNLLTSNLRPEQTALVARWWQAVDPQPDAPPRPVPPARMDQIRARVGGDKWYATAEAVCVATGDLYTVGPLRHWCRKDGTQPKKVEQLDGELVNAYPAAAWLSEYGIDIAEIFK